MYPVRRQISPHATRLRRNRTDGERKLWYAVRDRRLGGFKFRRQVTVGIYIVDFLCMDAKLVIELDGGQHDQDIDRKRTAYLEASGYRVLRFWNSDVTESFDGVLERTVKALLA